MLQQAVREVGPGVAEKLAGPIDLVKHFLLTLRAMRWMNKRQESNGRQESRCHNYGPISGMKYRFSPTSRSTCAVPDKHGRASGSAMKIPRHASISQLLCQPLTAHSCSKYPKKLLSKLTGATTQVLVGLMHLILTTWGGQQPMSS